MSEIAIYGGTFDPPTLSHERIIRVLLSQDSLDEVWVMPSGGRLDKPDMSSDQQRMHYLNAVKKLSFNEDPRLVISDFECNLPQPNRTTQTVQALEALYPEHRFWFVFGADSYEDMPHWENGLPLRDSLRMILVPRVGYRVPPKTDRVRHLAIRGSAISSTLVRERLARKASVKGLVSAAVLQKLPTKL